MSRGHFKLTIVRESTVFEDGRKKPMFSKAHIFGGLVDGLSATKKYFYKLYQLVIVLVDNRVGKNAGDSPTHIPSG